MHRLITRRAVQTAVIGLALFVALRPQSNLDPCCPSHEPDPCWEQRVMELSTSIGGLGRDEAREELREIPDECPRPIFEDRTETILSTRAPLAVLRHLSVGVPVPDSLDNRMAMVRLVASELLADYEAKAASFEDIANTAMDDFLRWRALIGVGQSRLAGGKTNEAYSAALQALELSQSKDWPTQLHSDSYLVLALSAASVDESLSHLRHATLTDPFSFYAHFFTLERGLSALALLPSPARRLEVLDQVLASIDQVSAFSDRRALHELRALTHGASLLPNLEASLVRVYIDMLTGSDLNASQRLGALFIECRLLDNRVCTRANDLVEILIQNRISAEE
jgi:hypothetical protein